MTKERLVGLLKLSLAHHPLCWQYRNHTIKIFNIKFCLGCTGFYSGLTIGGLFILFTSLFSPYSWTELVFLSTLLYLPTMLRLINLPFFNTSNKNLRLLFRFLLGFGVSTGLLSIFIANNLLIQITQFLLGIGLYAGLTIHRARNKDFFKECETCSFTRSPTCPGFKPFHPDSLDIEVSIVNPSNN